MKIHRNMLVGLGIVAAVAAAPSALWAATNGFVVPTFRGSANSQSGYWETFTVPVGAPGNAPDQPGATTSAVLTQTNAGAILASGNIYNPATRNAFVIADAPPFAPATVVLQTRTAGNPLDYNSVALNYSDGGGAHSVAPLFRYELSLVGGGVSSLWQWDLTGLNVGNYTITFNGSAPHVSLDAVTLDTAAQFAPAFVGQPFSARSAVATLARWDYLASDLDNTRGTASVFGAVSEAPDFDARDAQYLLGWNTTNSIPAGQGARNYLIRRVRVTLTIASEGYVYTGKLRDYRSYFPVNDPRYVTPVTANCPVELFGAGFRGGFTNEDNVFVPWASTNYPQTGPWSSDPNYSIFDPNAVFYAVRVAYAAGFNTDGLLVDVSDNVGDDGTAEIAHPLEVAPFAVGQSTNVAEGGLMPVGSQLTFDLNLDDPLIYAYVQNSLNEGNLSFVASSLVPASQTGPATYASFYTIFSSVADTNQFPLLDIEGTVVRTNVDSDADDLPDDWENFYFGTLAGGATNDPDGDGVNNLAEYRAGTIPTSGTNVFRLLTLTHQTNGTELHFAAAPSRQYTIQWADSLQNWQTVTNPPVFYSSAWLDKTGTNLTYPSPVFAGWRDTNAASPQRFYRVGAQ
jgi:hypothetical protein